MNKLRTKITALMMGMALTVGLLAGCAGEGGQTETGAPDGGSAQPEQSQTAQTRTVTDMAGNEVEIPLEVETYGEVWRAHNEVLLMLDHAQGMVATVMTPESYPWIYMVQPEMHNALSTFGSDFNLEELVALEPDVVFSNNEKLRDQLSSVGIPVLNATFETFDEMKRSISFTAEVLGGEAVQIAERYAAYLDEVLALLDEQVSKLDEADKPVVLHGNEVYKLNIDGGNTIIDGWITSAGGINAAAEVDGSMQTVTLEQILAWDPDVIITGTASEVEQILSDPEWAGLTAVQNGRVYANPSGVFAWDRAGVEEALQLQWAANLLHPELFEIDIRTEIKEFYETFLHYTLTDDQVERILNAQDPE